MRAEYDLSKLKGRERGKYVERCREEKTGRSSTDLGGIELHISTEDIVELVREGREVGNSEEDLRAPMSSFNEPNGICFHFGDELPALAVSAAIRKITSFLQAVEPYVGLQKYDDWWEHDGLHFHRGQLDFDALYAMINSPKQLLESTPEDDFVFVGVAPADNAWYLRYRVEWDESESELIGSCSVILPEHLANRFRAEVKPRLKDQPAEIDSETFYQKVKL